MATHPYVHTFNQFLFSDLNSKGVPANLAPAGRGRGHTPAPTNLLSSSPAQRRKDPAKPEPPKPPAQTLEDFIVKDLLGKGAFGEVCDLHFIEYY